MINQYFGLFGSILSVFQNSWFLLLIGGFIVVSIMIVIYGIVNRVINK